MPGRHLDHDPVAAADDRGAVAAVAEVFAGLRLQGAIFLRGEYTEGWAYESVPSADAAALLAPGAQRAVLFHVVAAGERHWAVTGDVIVLPYNHQHRMGGTADAVAIPIASLIEPPPWEQMPVIRYGQGGSSTSVVCAVQQTTRVAAASRGRARAVRDPVLRRAHVSVSVLDERFREVLGLAPTRYLTGWRMHDAEDLLRSSDLAVAAVARRVGYESKEAFSRAFKRVHGEAPSLWRVAG